jgi:hypothetical protein
MGSGLRLLALATAVVAGLAMSGLARAGECPTETFLAFDHLAYEGYALPVGANITPGAGLGTGVVDEPTDSSGCKRRRTELAVRRAADIEPEVAVLVTGHLREIFVLGARCAQERDVDVGCLRSPLLFGGRRYTRTSYPASPAPRGRVPLGAGLGRGVLAGRPLAVARIRGVDPSLAVGVRGRPSDAFVAGSVCPYERFANTPAADDLLRCLRSPVWYTFDPPGAQVGSRVVARADRAVAPELVGATVNLIRLARVGDVVPRDRSGSARVGRPTETLVFDVPDLPAGLYEAVVTCSACAATFDGQTVFAAGSLLVAKKPETSLGIRVVSYALGFGVAALAIASVIIFLRRRRASGGPRPETGR